MTIANSQEVAQPTIGLRLLALRKRHGATQAAFAIRLGIPKSTYVSWERDEAEPPLRLLEAVRNACGARDAAELGGFASEPTFASDVDWVMLGKLCEEVARLSKRAGYDFQVQDVVEIAGLVYERGPASFDEGLRDAEQLLRIGRRRG